MLVITDIKGNFVTKDDEVVITYHNRLYTADVAKVCPNSVLVVFKNDCGVDIEVYIPCGKFVKVEF